MKRYSLTKITVKTGEIISVSKDAAHENHISFCPVCNTPLSAIFPPSQSSTGASGSSQKPAELPAAKILDND